MHSLCLSGRGRCLGLARLGPVWLRGQVCEGDPVGRVEAFCRIGPQVGGGGDERAGVTCADRDEQTDGDEASQTQTATALGQTE